MDDLEHTMDRIGRIITADSTLTVEVRGDAAYAERGRVVLPALERYEDLGTDNAYRLLHGLVDHECGHAADTDFDVVERVAKDERKGFRALVNALEDGYIEARRGLEYPGSRFNLAQKNEWFWTTDFGEKQRSVVTRLSNPEGNLFAQVLLALTMHVRPYGGRTVDEIADVNPIVGMAVAMLEPIVAGIPALAGESQQTGKVVEIAEQVYALLAGGDGEGGDDDGEGEAQVELRIEGEGGGEGGGEAMGKVRADLERFEAGEGDHGPLNPEDAITVSIRRVFEQPDHTRPYVVFDPSFDIERDFSSELTETLTAAYNRYREEADAITSQLVSTFEAALFAKRERRLAFNGDEEGEIDVPLLGEYAVGAARAEDLWINYTAEEEGDHAAVAILIDCSGSMGNGVQLNRRTSKLEMAPSYLARLCAIACHEALKRCQIPHELAGFTTMFDQHVTKHPWAANRIDQYTRHFNELRRVCVEAHAHGTDLRKFARTCKGNPSYSELQVPIYGVFKGFGADDGRGLCLIAGIANNLDGEAILWQARRLARRPERRRVLIVLSDGYPAGSHDNAQGARYLSDAVKRALASGIEVYGIGIMSTAVEEFYPHSWVCRDLTDLPSILFRALYETVVDTGTETWSEGPQL